MNKFKKEPDIKGAVINARSLKKPRESPFWKRAQALGQHNQQMLRLDLRGEKEKKCERSGSKNVYSVELRGKKN